MANFKRLLIVLMSVLLFAAPLSAAEDEFAAAKAQLAQDREALVKSAGAVIGVSGAVSLVGYAVNKVLHRPVNLIKMTSQLASPSRAYSKSAKYLIKEKERLQKESRFISRVVAITREWEKDYKKGNLSEKRYKHLRRGNEILEKIFKEHYGAFIQDFNKYKADYKEFTRTGKISRIENAAAKIARQQAARSGQQVLRRGAKALPVVMLMIWAASTEVSAEEAAIARRMAEQPALLFSLTKEEENKIQQSPALKEIYIHTAQEIHQLRSLSAEQWQALAAESAGKEFAEKQLPLLRMQLIKAMAK